MTPVARSKDWNRDQDMLYPAPVASHEEVAKDPIVFWDSLRRFHFHMNTKFMIPVIGGKELDLHILYVEVTRRGGFEKVYFFKMQGPLCRPTVTFPVSSSPCKPELALVQYSPKTINDSPTPHPHIEGIGTIDAKFDCGYLVTVKLGSEILSGVLYHPEDEGPSTQVSAPVPQCSNALVPYTGKPRHSRRKRKSKRRGDPNYPKPNRSGYNFFFAEKHYKLKSLFPNREREFTKMIGESWSNLSPEERMVYQNIGLKDKERYKRELKEYKEKMTHRQAMEVNQAGY
ncbi:hypothetical protein TIFTF001_004942 [Ficus carica]|uniref:High mobility group B protein 9 n=1 Tax=Ficus carica TaxID=3494 RepID=A0AA88CU01_FICCA|nr:hypothetical protein TIFTF001_004942 [Ficus carica]